MVGRRSAPGLGRDRANRHIPESSAPLDRAPPVPHPFFHSLGQAIYEIALNEHYHIGQIAALRKLLGKARVM